MRRYLLDSNAVNAFINRHDPFADRVREARNLGDHLGTCEPVIAELYYGLEFSASRDENIARLDRGLTRLGDLNPRLKRFGCHIRLQGPLTLPPYDEPEPDGAIVRGSIDDYRDHHPKAADVVCVIEVADASLRRDRDYKQGEHADAGIPAYLIINLVDNFVEGYSRALKGKGRYGLVETRSAGGSVSFVMPGRNIMKIPVRRLLP